MEKEFIGTIVNKTFSELKSEVINRFFNIKENILKSSIYSFDKYNIYGTVLNREDLGLFENHFYPVLEEDLEGKNLLERINHSNEEIFVENILINEHSSIIDYLDNTVIKGEILTDKGVFSVLFRVKKNKRYLEKTYELYKITERNKVNWQVPNLPYANKYMSVYLEDYDEAVLDSLLVKEIKYELEVSYLRDLIFCWNIREKEYDYTEYVKPTEEQLTYEYIVNVPYNKKYLLNQDKAELMISYIADEENIIFITNRKIENNLKLLEILEKTGENLKEYLIYDVYSNETDFISENELFYHKEDLINLVNSLSDIQGMELEEVLFDKGDNEILETLNYNYFLKEEFEIKNKRDKVYLKLKYKESIFLNETAAYITSVLNIRNKDFEFLILA